MDGPKGPVHFFSYQTFLLKKHVDLFSISGILVNMDNEKVIVEALARRAKPKAKKPKSNRRRVKPEKVSTIQNRLYKKWSMVVHELAGNRCEVCGAEGKLDAHHVQPRQICSGLRFDPRNGICLCPSHHKWGRESAHRGMLWFVDWFQHNRPEDYGYLMARLDSELNCKDRGSLYLAECKLHDHHENILGKLPYFQVEYTMGDIKEIHEVLQAPNGLAAADILIKRKRDEGYRHIKVTEVRLLD